MERTAVLSQPGAAIVIVPAGLSRVEVGRRLASRLISDDPSQVQLVHRGVHPDLIELVPKTGKGSIGIEQVREVIRTGQFAPVEGWRKVCLIPHGEALTPEAENALLKVLEEPSRELSFVILIGEAQDLLPTIRSRSRIVRLPAPGTEELVSRLLGLGYPDETAAYLVGLMAGEELAPLLEERVDVAGSIAAVRERIDRAKTGEICALAVGDDSIEAYEAVIALLSRIARQGAMEAVRAARGVATAGREAVVRFFARAERAVFAAVRCGHGLFPPHPGIDALMNSLGNDRLVALARDTEEARRAVEEYSPAEGVLLSYFLRLRGMDDGRG